MMLNFNRPKKLKNFGLLLTHLALICIPLISMPGITKADCAGVTAGLKPDENCLDALGKVFDSGSGKPVVTFTDFKGELAAPDSAGYAKGLTQAKTLREYILNVTNFFLGFLGLIAVVVIIYGGILTVASAGDPEKAGKGKKALNAAAVGLIIVMSSFAFVNTIILAPSGSEKNNSTGSGTSTTLRGVSGTQKFNVLAKRMEELALLFKNSVNYHYNLASTLKSLNKNLTEAYKVIKTKCDGDLTAVNNCDDWNQGIDAKLSNYRNIAMSGASSLNEYRLSNSSNLTTQTYLTNIIERLQSSDKAYNAAKDKAAGNGCLGAGTCQDKDASAIFDTFVNTNGPANTPDLLFGAPEDPAFIQLATMANLGETTTSISKEIESINSKIKNLSSATTSFGGSVFDTLKTNLSTVAMSGGGLAKSPEDVTKNAVVILGLFNQAIDILKNVQSTDAVLTADVQSGNAPLIVNFSSVGSSDPSGLGVTDAQIHWDLNGDDKFDTADIGDDKSLQNCKPTAATASCTFIKPGTYRVILTVDPSSADNKLTGLKYNQEIAPGESYIDIKVNPASTKINLNVATNSSGPQDVIKYDDNGLLITDKALIPFTISEAKAGIVFNASETTLPDGVTKILNSDEVKIKWNFGTKSDFNDVLQTPSKGTLEVTQAFPGGGKYPVRLEVYDKKGVVDRKIFTILVSEVAPRISTGPTQGTINQEMTFDGSNSTTEGKEIIFKWKVEKMPIKTALANSANFLFNNLKLAHAAPLSGTSSTPAFDPDKFYPAAIALIDISPTAKDVNNDLYHCKVEDGKDDILKCTFKRAGDYKITLNIEDKDGNVYPDTRMVSISSNLPVAAFKYKSISNTAPAVYKLDAKNLSFDPDDKDTSLLSYSWEINPDDCVFIGYADTKSDTELMSLATDNKSAQTSCADLKEYSPQNSQPVVKFTKKGDFTANLLVKSLDEPKNISAPAEQIIKVDNVLDVNWGDMKPSAILAVPNASPTDPNDPLANVNNAPVAPVSFKFNSSQAVSYELDFGDGTNVSGDLNKTGEPVVHNYTKTGKYKAKLSVFDADDVENSITRNIFIGDGNAPVAILTTKINGNEIEPTVFEPDNTSSSFPNTITVSRKDTIIFDAEKSLNTDGTGRRLQYSWNINDNAKQSTARTVSYQFDTLSGPTPYQVKLKVINEKDATQFGEDTVNIMVVGESPTLRSLTAVPEGGSELTTPVQVRLNAVGAEDHDGQIIQYKWWYYKTGEVPSPDGRMGVQITSGPTALLTIGTRGAENEKPSYSFGVEITDNDNQTMSTDSSNPSQRLVLTAPTIQVTNGPNKAPIAKFTVDRTSVNLGETVNFASSSIDQDVGGSIKEYIWDFGDGSKGPNQANVDHKYQKANLDGYKAKLTVIDNNFSQSTSDVLKIYVDAVAKPPVAGFTTKTTPGSKTVNFQNTSTADTDANAKIDKYVWDFDINNDANGDGIKDNDTDATSVDTSYSYPEFGIYRAKLTVTDTQGQSKSVTNFVNVKPAESPKPKTPGSTGGGSTTAYVEEGAVSAASLSAGANIFKSSSEIDPTLLIASLGAYAILHLAVLTKKKIAKS